MFKGATRASVRMVERYLPDAFVLVLMLTLVVFAAGMLVEGQSPIAMMTYWGEGFWNLLAFSMQMVLILVTGFVVASTPPFRKLLRALARLPRTPGQAIILVTLVSLVAAWINWGFGLVIGAFFARELGRQVEGLDYRLAIASAYSGFMIWHGGLSGSIPLVIATEGHFAQELIGIIPTSETLFSTLNLGILLGLLLAIPLVNRLIMPSPEETVTVDPARLAETEDDGADSTTLANGMDDSRLISILAGGLGLLYVAHYFLAADGGLNLNIVNFMFLFVAIILHQTPKRLLASLNEAVKGGAGIVIQFPFYAGIMSVMTASGLAASISTGFVSIASAESLPFWSFISAGVVNIFVPSGGGQWAVQAPVMLPAAQELGADISRVAMGVAWGDAWTNLLQPFWALPVLAIAGLKAKDIMGYCLMLLIVTGIIISAGLTWL